MSEALTAARYELAQLDELPGIPCPCGTARRAFAAVPDGVATLHMTDISADAVPHYHREMTELYFVLSGEGHMELDGERVPIKPGTGLMIHPGCRHRAVGDLRVMIVAIPKFDPADEHFD